MLKPTTALDDNHQASPASVSSGCVHTGVWVLILSGRTGELQYLPSPPPLSSRLLLCLVSALTPACFDLCDTLPTRLRTADTPWHGLWSFATCDVFGILGDRLSQPLLAMLGNVNVDSLGPSRMEYYRPLLLLSESVLALSPLICPRDARLQVWTSASPGPFDGQLVPLGRRRIV